MIQVHKLCHWRTGRWGNRLKIWNHKLIGRDWPYLPSSNSSKKLKAESAWLHTLINRMSFMFPNNNELNKFLRILNKFTKLFSLENYSIALQNSGLHNHNLMTYQWRQNDPLVQLRRRLETVSVRFNIEVKRGTYDLPPALGSEQQTEPLGPGGKIYMNWRYYKQQRNCKYNPGRQTVSLVLNASIKDHLTDFFWPALSAKSIISFCLDAKLVISERDVQDPAMVWATKRIRILAITLNCILNWGIWETAQS